MCRNRSLGSVRTPSASATSCPWAQVSMSRADTNDSAPIGGPNHGTRARSSRVPVASLMVWRARRHQASTSAPDMARPRRRCSSMGSPVAARAASAMTAKRPGSVMAMVAASSKKARWLTWSRMAQPSAGVGSPHDASPSGATSASRTACSRWRSSSSECSDPGSAMAGSHYGLEGPGPVSQPGLPAPARAGINCARKDHVYPVRWDYARDPVA